ncbi:MAG TPA: ROK family protein [Candidatus Saccharimonadales bacterium]|nr:ROK family protein [Candidatus Saccharimonadales bacterium]
MLVTVDTGGTKTLIASFEQNGKIGKTIKFPTPPNQDEYVTLLRETLQKNYSNAPVEALVVALPGIIKDGVALWCNNLHWKNFDAQNALAGVLGATPVFIENDANLAGLAETRILDPMPFSSLYVTISTGIGTGIITEGHINPGLRYSEGGRALVEFDGVVREWESFASGKAIYQTYGKYARDITNQRTWQQIADRISRGFLAAVPIIQPDVVIIGGSIGTYFNQYSDQLEAILREKLPPHIACPRFIQAKHPEEAVIYGCYYYALDYITRD